MLVRLHNFAATTLHRNSINSQSVRTLQPRSKPMLPPISPGIQQRKKEERKNKQKKKDILVGSKITNCNCNHLFRPYIIFQKEHTESHMYDTYFTLLLPRNQPILLSTLRFIFILGLNVIFLCFGVWYCMTIMSSKLGK